MDQLLLIGMIAGLFAGLGGLGWGLSQRMAEAKQSGLGESLQIYGMGTDMGGVTFEVELDDDTPDRDASLIESELIRKAVDVAGKVAEERGLLPGIVRKLEAADVPLRAQEALFLYLAGGLLVSAAVIALAPIFLLGAVGAAVVFALPPMVLSVIAARRRKKFAVGLPDTLNLFASALRAGYSLGQAVESVAHDSTGSMGKELKRAVAEVRLGRNLEPALLEVANRMESQDFQWVVLAIKVQREVGGNLAELLDTVADTIIQRQRLKREVRTLTAEARASAVILAVMTPVLGLVISQVNPDYMIPFVKSSLGRMMLGGALVWTMVGFVWMKKVTAIDV